MTQFYKEANELARADYYREILAIPTAERMAIAENAERNAQRYLIGGSSHYNYQQDRSTKWTYERTDEQLREIIASHEAAAAQSVEDEYGRSRQWLVSAFMLNKQVKRATDAAYCYREHNLMCARQWIGREWKNYKAARKRVKGF